ncbi:acetyl-CoA carboxylase biotin carboxylase subunit [Candidatus Woesearchaeota archaeon]|nr:acetyl-CoA carboxylase biotin carboxylase subunit [Candidatus Woesearchaeota archaeon]
MFKKILIANRGEAAVRVIEACKDLGITSVVIYTQPDKDSLPVHLADENHLLEKNGNNLNPHLDMQQIIDIAKKANADALHPGYGFLSENADFAQLCEENKIKFIGPSPTVMKKMGDKIEAKQSVSDMDIPVVPGFLKPVEQLEQIQTLAQDIGFPVILKAASGGGGKGIRVANGKEDVTPAFQSVQKEAEMAFGNSPIYIEKFIKNPRHIEFQVVADQHGNVVHLGERECSIQRRHQKLVEEAPSAALTPKMRENMGQAAVTIAKNIGYEGVGSVEFLLDGNKFYFMEMNTRLQVEHAITERITGIDLVKEQINIAYGNSLPYTQDKICYKGWAIECRINAESVKKNFTPSWGTIKKYNPPEGPGISISSAVVSGSDVSPHYDSMIAKLIVHGSDRQEAITRAKHALHEYTIDGVETTISLHKTILDEPSFVTGEIDTSFIDKYQIVEKVSQTPHNNHVIIAAAVSHYLKSKDLSMPENDKPDPWIMAARHEAMHSLGAYGW